MSDLIPDGWESTEIGSYVGVQGGCAFKSEDFCETGIPIVRISNIKKDGSIDLSGSIFAQYDTALSKFQIRNGDVLIAMSGATTGKVGRYRSNNTAYLNQRVGRFYVRDDSKVELNFVHQVTSTSQFIGDVLIDAAGGAQPNISNQQIEAFNILLPPLPEQQKIATILSSVDDVIEKTRAQIDKLKDLKTGMMQELLTKGVGHTEFKDSPVGRIPAAWGCKTLDQLATFVTSGSRGWAQYYSDAGPIFIRIGNLTREHINLRFNDTVHVCPPDSAEGKRTQVQLGDVLISITADLGVIGVVNESIGEAYVNQHISLVRLRDPSEARWVGHFLAFENTQKQFTANNDSGAKAGLNLPAIRNTLVAIPTKSERDKIVETLDSIDTDIVMKRTMLERISSVKKALMQDLLTGKVRVKVDAQNSAE